MPEGNAALAAVQERFQERTRRLVLDLVEQGGRVRAMVEGSFAALFAGDRAAAAAVKAQDDVVDAVDVQLEQASVALLTEATSAGAALDTRTLRTVLMIVKINNELERIADVAVELATLTENATAVAGAPAASHPPTFRIMANSVIGIVRDSVAAVAKGDAGAALATTALKSQHAVGTFKAALLKDAEQRLSKNTMTVDAAFQLHEIAAQCERIADHCTNIAEQVIYTSTGAIVRHAAGGWEGAGGPSA